MYDSNNFSCLIASVFAPLFTVMNRNGLVPSLENRQEPNTSPWYEKRDYTQHIRWFKLAYLYRVLMRKDRCFRKSWQTNWAAGFLCNTCFNAINKPYCCLLLLLRLLTSLFPKHDRNFHPLVLMLEKPHLDCQLDKFYYIIMVRHLHSKPTDTPNIKAAQELATIRLIK